MKRLWIRSVPATTCGSVLNRCRRLQMSLRLKVEEVEDCVLRKECKIHVQ